IDRAARIGAESLARDRRQLVLVLVVARLASRDRAAGGSEPARGSDLETAVRAEWNDALRTPLPVRRRADDERAVVVLERAGDDLRRAGAASVDEDRERKLRPALLRRIGVFTIRVGNTATHAHDLLAGIEEQVRYTD